MKSLYLVAALVIVAGSAAGAGVVATALTNTPVLRVVTSFYPLYVTTLNIVDGVPGVTLRNLTRPTAGCLHDYQLTPAEMRALAEAGVFIINGAGMESFLAKATNHLPALTVINASAGLELLREAHGMNPHVWVSVRGAIGQARAITAGLCARDPRHAAAYQRNAAAYIAQLEALRAELQVGLSGATTRTIITFHEAFPYFAHEFGLTVAAVIEREPGSEPNPRELADTIALVRTTGVTTLCAEPQYSARAAQAIARETGARVYLLDPAVTGPPQKDAYLTIMRANLATLQRALRR
jgi:zinc transport system substrate-binding protein